MNYDDKSIKILEGLEAVRKRPGMYIGSTDKRGLHHLVWEIVDNAIDEVINGYGNEINIKINKDGSISIKDYGRGVPAGMHESGISTPEVIYTVLHSGGKFETSGYKISGGLHGVGASVVNALSKWMKVIIKRDKNIYEIEFKNGGHVSVPLHIVGNTKETGTEVIFMPDDTIFKNISFSYTTICERMQENAFLISNLTINVIDEISEKSNSFHYENGIVSYIDYINEDKEALHKVIYITGVKNNIEVNVALQYTDSYNESIISFANNVKTVDGGAHEVGFKTALTKVFNDYARKYNLIKGKMNLEGVDTREGLSAIISLHIPEDILQFEGQTKSKLGTPIARSVTESIIYEKLSYFLEENKESATIIMEKALKSHSIREEARKVREEARTGKGKKEKEKMLLGKLTPAQSKKKEECELFLVEGISAGGSAKNGRDKKFQAILPLRGKVINALKTNEQELFKNEEINLIVHAVGTGVGIDCDPKLSNYNKIIIMSDADVDGSHIQTLLLTFFYQYMRPLLENGYIYLAVPPLYLVSYGKEKKYFMSDEELEEFKSNFKGNYTIQRYKGLGEMNSDQLWDTTMNPMTRTLIRINIKDANLVMKRVNVLMGNKVEPRKEWINENVEFTLEDDYRS